MDYSLLLGIHDVARGEIENKERLEREEDESDEDEDSGSGLDNRGSGGDRYAFGRTTPPDSPGQLIYQYEGAIIPELDIYAVPSSEGKKKQFERRFLMYNLITLQAHQLKKFIS